MIFFEIAFNIKPCFGKKSYQHTLLKTCARTLIINKGICLNLQPIILIIEII